jgi:DICT domain-containing protein
MTPELPCAVPLPVQLAIRDVAEQTGIAAGTLRMWEQRYGFPTPARTETGYRRYPDDVVDVLRRVVELRGRGLSVPAAIEAARRDDELTTDRPSIYAAIAAGQSSHTLRKRTLIALSRAIEDEAMSRAAAPVAFGAFQEERFYRRVEARYRRLARTADAVTVFADFPRVAQDEGVLELPIAPEDALGAEWAVIVDAPGYAACLVAWEPARDEEDGREDLDRRFEAVWSVDPEVTRRASLCAARLVTRVDAEAGGRIEALLADRPMAVERPGPALCALTSRMVGYLDGSGDG